MPEYIVTASNTPVGVVFLGAHNASSPENAVQRARENFEPERMEQEIAVSKEEEFKVYEIKEKSDVQTN